MGDAAVTVNRNVTLIRYATDVLHACGECGVDFHGRVDAVYCSTGCRQRAYRHRHRPTPRLSVSGPVPVGGVDRGRYRETFEELARRYYPNLKGADLLDLYVSAVAGIGIHTRIEDGEDDKDDEPEYDVDLTTPLGDKLPKELHSLRAKELAEQLTLALDRQHELLDLLHRRAQEEP